MKKLLKLTLFIIVGFLYSCSKDLLDVANPNTPTSQVFWKTENDATLGLNAVYHAFYAGGTWQLNMFFRNDLTSDEGWSNSPALDLAEYTRFIYSDYNDYNENTQIWKYHYKAILRANLVIANVSNITFTDESKKKDIIAQAKFLRGFYYFYLAILYENVPLVLNPSNAGDAPKQNTLTEVFTQCIEDFTEAAADLPATRASTDLGRATKGAALAYLGKVYMQMGNWQAAKDAFYWLIEGDGATNYGLMDNYRDNFKHTTENNKESVFEIQFSDVNQVFAGLYGISNDIPSSNVGCARAQYFGIKGIGWCDAQPRRWIIDEYYKETNATGGLDIRLRDNFFYPNLQTDFPGEKIYGQDWSVLKWGSNTVTSNYWRKYQNDYWRTYENNYSPINYRTIRYADVLLCYAECLAQLNTTPPALAIQCVNRVRQRKEVNLLPLESSIYANVCTDKTLFLNRLKVERSLELCAETVRWIDLKRWKPWNDPTEWAALLVRDPDFNNFVKGKSERLPIPQLEVDNNPNLTQNPGY
jgi:starch-binding outer membrane protein, SusD/RagB family